MSLAEVNRLTAILVLLYFLPCQDDIMRRGIERGLLRYCTQFRPLADVYMKPTLCLNNPCQSKGIELTKFGIGELTPAEIWKPSSEMGDIRHNLVLYNNLPLAVYESPKAKKELSFVPSKLWRDKWQIERNHISHCCCWVRLPSGVKVSLTLAPVLLEVIVVGVNLMSYLVSHLITCTTPVQAHPVFLIGQHFSFDPHSPTSFSADQHSPFYVQSLLRHHIKTFVLEGTECTAAWCSVDNWQPLTCGVYFYGELKESNKERWVVLLEANTTM